MGIPVRYINCTPFNQPPQPADAFDFDARTASSPDLAVNGWLVNDLSTGAVLTRAGDVQRFGSRPATNTYESTLLNGLLFIRTPASQTLVISKLAQPGVAGYTLRTHAWVTKQTSNGSFLSSAEAFVWSAGVTSSAGPVTFGASQSQTNWMGCEDSRWMHQELIQGNFPTVHQQVDITQPHADIVNYIHVAAFGASQTLKYDAGTAFGFLQPGTAFSHTMTRVIDRAGLFAGSGPDGYVVIDSICKLPYMTFP